MNQTSTELTSSTQTDRNGAVVGRGKRQGVLTKCFKPDSITYAATVRLASEPILHARIQISVVPAHVS